MGRSRRSGGRDTDRTTGELLVSGAALRAAGELASAAQPRGKMALRGRSEPVDVYAVTL